LRRLSRNGLLCHRRSFVGGLRLLSSHPTRRSSDLGAPTARRGRRGGPLALLRARLPGALRCRLRPADAAPRGARGGPPRPAYARDRKSTRLNSSHAKISYAGFCLKKKELTHKKLVA